MDGRTARVVGAAAVAGLALALVATALLPSTYRASGAIVLSREGRAPGDDPGLAPATRAAAALLDSRAVVESAIANLRLDVSPGELLARLDVAPQPESSLILLGVEARDPDEARRIAQELAEVFAVLYNTRFGPATTASIWQAPRAEEDPVSPRAGLNAAFGLAAGTLAGLAFVSLRRRPAPRRIGPVAATGEARTIAELELALVATPASDPTADDRRFYLDALREYAEPDGRLDPAFEPLIHEVFADTLPERS